MDKKDNFYNLEIFKVFNQLQTSKNGLTQIEADRRIGQNGYNELENKSKRQTTAIFLSQFQDWLVLILLVAALISFFLGDRLDSLVIIAIVFLSVVFGFIQEYRAEKTLAALKKFITYKVRVLRDSQWTETESKHLCVGDIIKLRIGDRVPADLRLVELDSLTIDESILTGESSPAIKSPEPLQDTNISSQEQKNMAFAGTYVFSGTGIGVICAVGKDTILGETAKSLEKEELPTDFQKQTHKFSQFLFKVIILLVVFVFVANAFLGKGYLESFLFAVALAVGIAPELLPMIITVTLSQGAMKMAKNKVVVKKLISVENLGNIDTLCADKTGTLTEGKFSLTGFLDINLKESDTVLTYALLCTSNFSQGGNIASNELDKALWANPKTAILAEKVNKFKLIDENEFDYTRRRTSVLVEGSGKRLLIVKGAPESIFSVCKNINTDIKEKIFRFEKQGKRVILVASKEIHKTISSLLDEKELDFAGVLLFSDPVKADTKKSLELFQHLGVRIKIISGDSPQVVQNVASEVGLVSQDTRVITGDELAVLSETQIVEYAEKYSLFAGPPRIKRKNL